MDNFKELLDNIPSVVFIIDNTETIVYANKKMSKFASPDINAIVGKKCYELLYSNKAACKDCPLATDVADVAHTYDIITMRGRREILNATYSTLPDGNTLVVCDDITRYVTEIENLTHKYKECRAAKVVMSQDVASLQRGNKAWANALDSVSEGFMIVDDKYNIVTINKMLKSLSLESIDDLNSVHCYNVYGFSEPCKDCPYRDKDIVKSLRVMSDKNITVHYSRSSKYIVESLRDTTRELKLIDEIRTNQIEISEKQRQMSILNTDLLRMNEKLKSVQLMIDDELKQVGYIQESLLPKNLPEIEGYKFGALYIPAEHAGGDYYDCIEMSNNYLGVLVADVSGHGTPAAVIMAITRAIMRSYTYDIISSSEAITMVNDILCDNIYTKDFVTMFYAVMEPKLGKINYASAGHNPVLLFDSSEFLVKKLTAAGMFLGTFAGLDYEQKDILLDDNDIFFMYTDGLVEAMNSKREQYGYDRLVSKIMMYSSFEPDKIIEEVMADVKDFVEGAKYEDDITIFAIKKTVKKIN